MTPAVIEDTTMPGNRSIRSAALLAPLAGLATACTLLTAAPPSAQVVAVELQSTDLLHPQLQMTLCLTNPNNAALAFQQVRVAMDVAGAPLADTISATPVDLPPHASVLVPFAVALSPGDLGRQLLGVVQTGALDYRVHGTVQLPGAIGLTLPFSRSGRLDLVASTAGLLADAAAPAANRCRSNT